jgi:hypothetical protein
VRAGRAALAIALVVLACGGGGGGGGGGGTNPGPSIVYTAGTGPGANSLALVRGGAGSSTQLLLNLDARSVSGVYGVGFDLLYPSQALSFVGVTKGTFLPGTTSLQVNSTTPGRLIVGLSRLGAAPGVSGSGTLLTIEFRGAGGAGSGAIGFENNSAFDASAKKIAGITWIGGDVTVTP